MSYQSQEEYLLDLAEELKYLHPKDATKVLNYYQQKIVVALEYGESIETVLSRLPSPSKAAQDAYDSHGLDYLEIRKRKLKHRNNLKKLVSTVLLIFTLISFIVISISFVGLIFNFFELIKNLIFINNAVDKILSVSSAILTIILYLCIYFYLIDLFLILFTTLTKDIVSFKDENKLRKFLNMSLTSWIDEHFKKKNVVLKAGGLILIFIAFLFIASIYSKGYVYRAINNQTSNKTEISLEEFTTLELLADELNIQVLSTDKKDPYLEYFYEFKQEPIIESKELITSIKFQKATSYGLLGIFKEPTRTVKLYLPTNDASLVVTQEKGNITVLETTMNSLKITKIDQATIVISNSTINEVEIAGYDLKTGITSSEIKALKYDSSEGQLVIENDTVIDDTNIQNERADMKFQDLKTLSLSLENEGGTVMFENVTGKNLSFTTRTSKSTLKNINFDQVDIQNSFTSSILLTNSKVESLKTKTNDSYLLVDQSIINDIIVDANNGLLFFTNVENKDLNIKNEGTSSKTELDTLTTSTLKLTQQKGYVLISDSIIQTSTLVLSQVDITEVKNIDGTSLDLYLERIGNYTSFTTEKSPTIHISLKKTDAISASSLTIDKAYYYTIDETLNN